MYLRFNISVYTTIYLYVPTDIIANLIKNYNIFFKINNNF